ncbi:MAG: hypothetical protein VX715_05215, partial [Planctomycetota bacterium]|nr:hypothetical protein [Planctomycetota bacterium]
RRFPSPTQPPTDVVSSAFEHMLTFGRQRELTPEELARAIHIDPSQIPGLGPSLEAILAILLERRRKILATYETDSVVETVHRDYEQQAFSAQAPASLADQYERAILDQQIYKLEGLWYQLEDERGPFARELVRLIETLGNQYQLEELDSRYEFHGATPLTVEQALAIKEELEKIDELIEQIQEARENAQIYVIDMEALAEFVEQGDMDQLGQMQQLVEDYLAEMAEQQGLAHEQGIFQLTPQAYRIFQGRLLARIFSDLEASRTGRHQGPVVGDGAVEMQQTKPYEFGDSLAQMDIPQSFINALLRQEKPGPLRLEPRDIEVHQSRNNPKCATTVIMDMSGSMRHEGQYINVKRMALALEGLIQSEYPGDYLQFIEMATFASPCQPGEIVELMPKPVTITDPVVRFKVDMSQQEISQYQLPPHFTNIQHSLQLARQFLTSKDTPNRQVILITDGLPTAHFDQNWLYMLYPPDPLTEEATMRESRICAQEGITINIFLVPSWSQSEEDIRFAYRMAEQTTGRVFFTAGGDLDRYVVWDYVKQRREVIG